MESAGADQAAAGAVSKPWASEMLRIIRRFREAVDRELGPEMFTWFRDDSLHVTLRALMG